MSKDRPPANLNVDKPFSANGENVTPPLPPRLWRSNWPAKLLVGWVLICAAFFWLALTNLRDSRTLYEQRAKTDTLNMTEVLVQAVKGGMDATEISLYSLARDPWTRDVLLGGPVSEKIKILNAFSAKQESGRIFHLYDEAGRLQGASDNESDATPDIEKSNIFRRLRANAAEGLVISKPLQSASTKAWSIVLALRLSDAHGNFRGVVSARIPLDFFYRLFAALDLGPHGAVSIRDLDNSLVVRFPNLVQESAGADKISDAMRTALAQEPMEGTYVSEAHSDGVYRTVSYKRVGHFPLNVFVGVASADYLAPWYREQRTAYFDATAFTAVTALLLWFVGSGIRKQERSATEVLGQEQKFRALLESAPDAMLVLDTSGIVQTSNRRTEILLKKERGSLRGLSIAQILDGHQRRVYPKILRRLVSDVTPLEGSTRRHIALQRSDGTKVAVAVSLRKVDASHGPMYVLDVRDVAEQKAARAKMRFLADHDALTGLTNRQKASDLVRGILRSSTNTSQSVAIVHLGLDHFKTINDSEGHATGDKFLIAIANRLKARRFPPDAVSRISGDEFLLVYSIGTAGPGFMVALEQLLVDIQIPVRIDDRSISTTASAGVAIFPDNADTVEELTQKANLAMYRAKSLGRNNVCYFDANTDAEAQDKHMLAVRLRRALWERELSLHYQPIVDLTSGKMAAVEALLRWTDPDMGVVSPARFIPVAEETGLIVAIGAWVLDEACRQSARWRAAGVGVPIAVNLSSVQFQREDIEEVIFESLRRHNLPPSAVQLELTESILIQETDRVLASLQHLKAGGIKISIDDFGTGYSSLSYLRRLNADKLKIDQSFVRSLCGAPEDVAIVKAIIQMAHSLGLVVVAEGVESEDILKILQDLNCDSAQGYLFAKPAAASALDFTVQYHAVRPFSAANSS